MIYDRKDKNGTFRNSKQHLTALFCYSQTTQRKMPKHNRGTMFEENSTRWYEVALAKKMVKSLFVWLKPSNFSPINPTTHHPLNYCNSKIYTVDNRNNSEKLQMEDILMPDAQLDAFDIELTPSTIQLLENTEKKQEEVLKWKEVSEEQLRMVVQL